MKRPFIALAIPIALAGIAAAQSATSPNEGSRLTLESGNTFSFKWHGQLGRTYFIQTSPDLLVWTYLPEIKPGANLISAYGLQTGAEKLFLRLRFSDLPTVDPFNDDFDGDGDSNWLELLSGTDPLEGNSAEDQDGDGLSDSAEALAGSDPLKKDNPNVHLSVIGFAAP